VASFYFLMLFLIFLLMPAIRNDRAERARKINSGPSFKTIILMDTIRHVMPKEIHRISKAMFILLLLFI
jgi:hypothetical protein